MSRQCVDCSSKKSRSKAIREVKICRDRKSIILLLYLSMFIAKAKQGDEAVEMIDVRYYCERERKRKVGAENSQKE